MLALQIASVLAGLCAFFLGVLMLLRFLMLYPSNKKFERMSRKTTAMIVGSRTYGSVTKPVPSKPIPVVEYYDEFQETKVQRAILHTIAIRFPGGKFPTDPIKIQYTEKQVRIYDPRYVNLGDYSGRRQGILVFLCAIAVLLCFIVLVYTIIS